jgi:hypothetical protein
LLFLRILSAAVIVATLPLLWRHLELFRLAGEAAFWVAVAGVPVLLVAPRFWRWGLWPAVVLPMAIVLWREPQAALFAAAFGWAAFGLGDRLVGRWLERPVLRLAVGFLVGQAVYGLVLFGLGLAGWLHGWVLALLLVPAWRPLPRFDWRGDWPALPAFFGVLFAGLGGAALVMPVWTGDAVRFHLMLSRLYAESGGLTPPQFEMYGYYPQAFELLGSWALLLGGEAGPQLIPGLEFVAFLGLVYECGRLLGMGRASAAMAVALVGTVPVLHWSGVTLKNDLMLSAYQLAAFVLYLCWRENKRDALLLAAVFLGGAAFTVKHTALFGGVALAPFLVHALWRRWRLMAAAVVLFALTAPIYPIRTWPATGNPAFPESASRAGKPMYVDRTPGALALRYMVNPWLVHFAGKPYFESGSENPLGVMLPVLLPAVLLGVRAPGAGALRWFTGLYVFYWISVLSVLRYALTPMAGVLLLAWRRAESRAWAPTLHYGFVFALYVTVVVELHPALPGYLLRLTGRETFLTQALPPFGAMHALRGLAGPEDLVYAVGNWAVAYAPYPNQVNHYYRTERDYPMGLLAELQNRPYRWLVVPADFAALPQYEPRYRDGHFVVYRLPGAPKQP